MTEGLTAAIVETVKSSEVADVVIDLGEVALDSTLSDGVLRDTPFLGTLVGLVRAGLGIRERLFLRKLASFLRSIATVDAAERAGFAERLANDHHLRDRVGSNLILLLDRADDLEKPALIGNAFRAFVQGDITQEQFRRIASAIDRADLGDLAQLRSCPTKHEFEAEWSIPLAAAGLVLVTNVRSDGYLSPGIAKISTLGGIALKVCFPDDSPEAHGVEVGSTADSTAANIDERVGACGSSVLRKTRLTSLRPGGP